MYRLSYFLIIKNVLKATQTDIRSGFRFGFKNLKIKLL